MASARLPCSFNHIEWILRPWKKCETKAALIEKRKNNNNNNNNAYVLVNLGLFKAETTINSDMCQDSMCER